LLLNISVDRHRTVFASKTPEMQIKQHYKQTDPLHINVYQIHA